MANPLTGILTAVGEVRCDMLDYPTAWHIHRRVGTLLLHHPKCSSRPQWAMLCDCGAVETCWQQLCAAQGIETRSAIDSEAGVARQGESPVGNADAPNNHPGANP